MHRFLLTWLVLAYVLGPVDPAFAGAWLRERGGVYLKSGWIAQSTTERWDCSGTGAAAEPFGGRYREHLLFSYVEWGATDQLTLVGSLGFKDARIVDAQVPDYGTRSTTDLRVGARLGLMQGNWPVSAEFVVSAPTYARTDPTLPVGQREQFLPAGSGHFESEVRLLAGRSLFPLPLYANLDVGYRARRGSFGDQWLFAAEAGGEYGRLFGKMELRAALPTGDLCASSSAGAVTFHERNWRWAPEVAVRSFSRTWLGLGASVPISARNALQGTQWTFSVAWQRRGS